MTTSAKAPATRSPFGAFFWVSALAVAAVVTRVVAFTPYEATQGAVQKVFYIHVPAALGAYLAFGIVAVTSVMYLWLRDERADRLAESAAEVGLVFTTVVLTTGPLWAKPIWGAWWSWDMRLNLTMFLWFLAVAYLVMRSVVEDAAMRARYSAVLGILAALLIPFIHLSVYMFRTMHPMPIVLKPSEPSLPPEMLLTWVLGVVAFGCLCVALIMARYRLAVARSGEGVA